MEQPKPKINLLVIQGWLLAYFLFSSQPSNADFKQKALSKIADAGACVALLAEPSVKSLMTNWSGRPLELIDFDTQKPFSINIGKKFGAGYFGGFYAVESTDVEALRTLPYAVGVKIPHVLKLFDLALPFAENEANREFELYVQLQKAVPEIEKDQHYPINPPWSKGSLPIVPISYNILTKNGRLLFKPIVQRAIFLDQIADEVKKTGHLPEKYVEGIKEVYALVQAVYSATKISPDVRPTNWLYIEDPDTMRIFGLKRPGFMLFEMSKVPKNLPKYIEPVNSVDDFIKEFMSYLK